MGVIYTGERDLMGPLLSTMKASAPGLDYRLILVDNHSPDGVEPWRQIIPETKVLKNTERLHYAANMNRILAASTARYVLVMNTDMFFDPRQRCLSRMVEFMDSHPHCGIAGCRLLHVDGHDARAARRFQTLSVILARRFGLGGVMRRTLERYFYMDHAPGESFDCQWLSGCFLMLRNEAIEKVGLFDESFGKYFEDVDMCLRMARAGLAGDVSRGNQCLPHRAARQPQVVLGRRLEAPAVVSLLAEQVGLSGNRGSLVQRAPAAGGVRPGRKRQTLTQSSRHTPCAVRPLRLAFSKSIKFFKSPVIMIRTEHHTLCVFHVQWADGTRSVPATLQDSCLRAQE